MGFKCKALLGKFPVWPNVFVMEIRRQDAQPYPQNTLFHSTAGIQRYLRSLPYFCDFSFLVSVFYELRKALGCQMKKLTA